MTSNAEHTAIPAGPADLIARARAVLDQKVPYGDAFALAERTGRLEFFVYELCAELEDAIDPDGRGRRLLARMTVLNALADELCAELPAGAK